MLDDVDQGILRLFSIGRNPVPDGFNPVFLEQTNGMVAEAGVEVVQLTFVRGVDAQFENVAERGEGKVEGTEQHGG